MGNSSITVPISLETVIGFRLLLDTTTEPKKVHQMMYVLLEKNK